MVIQVPEKFRRVAVREVITGAHQQRAGMGDLRRLGEIAVFCRVDVVEKPRKLPVPGGAGDALYPAHEGEGQHSVPVSALYLLADLLFFPLCHAGHHVGQIGGREQKEMFYTRVMIVGQVINQPKEKFNKA